MLFLDVMLRALIGTVFIAALGGKFWSREAWRHFVKSVGELRIQRARSVAVATVCAEASTVGLLVIPGTSRWGFLLALIMLAVFSAGLAFANRGGRKVRCHCFGSSSSEPVGTHYFVRNGSLSLACLLGVFTVPTAGPESVTAMALGFGAFGGFGIAFWPEIAHLFTPVIASASSKK